MNSLVRVRRNVAWPGPPTSRGAISWSFGGSSSGQPTECRQAAVANGSWKLPPVSSATGSGTTRAGRRWRSRRRRSSCGRWQGYVKAVLLELLPLQTALARMHGFVMLFLLVAPMALGVFGDLLLHAAPCPRLIG